MNEKEILQILNNEFTKKDLDFIYDINIAIDWLSNLSDRRYLKVVRGNGFDSKSNFTDLIKYLSNKSIHYTACKNLLKSNQAIVILDRIADYKLLDKLWES